MEQASQIYKTFGAEIAAGPAVYMSYIPLFSTEIVLSTHCFITYWPGRVSNLMLSATIIEVDMRLYHRFATTRSPTSVVEYPILPAERLLRYLWQTVAIDLSII